MGAVPEWLAWFDGAAAPNPGRLGLGALLVGPDGKRLEHSSLAGHGCNNEAELLALCQVLEMAHEAGARRLTVRGDSDFVVRHVRGLAHTTVPRLLDLLQRVATSLLRFDAVELLWVPRHRNGDADQLSRKALGLVAKPTPRPVSRRRR
ncbi:MAG: ribonuclease HI family protein [Betaproteobacteria bacterium]|nr:ribonuclease HI family protein [Betaproteobacteria bacterium]